VAETFVVTGWSEAAGKVVEVVVRADNAAEAKSKAGDHGLMMVVVRPKDVDQDEGLLLGEVADG
jgi:hypothetical protein